MPVNTPKNKPDDCFVLHNGYHIPCTGFGTYKVPGGQVATDAVRAAIEAGYRHIDAAAYYKNESSVGLGIRQSGIGREKLFITSKVWNTDRGYFSTKAAFAQTIGDLGLDYLDLYLIHWPAAPHRFADWQEINLATWQAMIELYDAGMVRAIGVSNFKPHHLEALMQTGVRPMVNQIEFHPGQRQIEVLDYCQTNGIVVEAWGPMGSGRLLDNADLVRIAAKYGKSVAQICIRWCLQNRTLPLARSVRPERINENLQVFDFSISDDDMAEINNMAYCGGSGHDPDRIAF